MSAFSLNPEYQETQVLLQHLLPQYEQQSRLMPILFDEIHLLRARVLWLEHEGLLQWPTTRRPRKPTREDFPHFSEEGYLEANPDVRECVQRKQFASAWDHFIQFGYREGRLRAPRHFNESSYLSLQFDVRKAVQDGEITSGYAHYISGGFREKRLMVPDNFDEEHYLQYYPEVRESLKQIPGATASQHYCAVGQLSGRLYFVQDGS